MNVRPPSDPPPAMAHPEARLALGALVLGALEPRERAAVEAHLPTCPLCTAELAELAELPGLLGRLTPDQAAAVDPHPQDPPDELLARILANAPARLPEPAARRRRVTAWTAGIVAVAAAATWVITVGPLAAEKASADVVVAGWDRASNVRGEVTLSPTPNGTSLDIALAGVQPGEQCVLLAGTADGHWEVASTWQATYQGEATVTGSTGLAIADIRKLKVKTADGRALLEVVVPQ